MSGSTRTVNGVSCNRFLEGLQVACILLRSISFGFCLEEKFSVSTVFVLYSVGQGRDNFQTDHDFFSVG